MRRNLTLSAAVLALTLGACGAQDSATTPAQPAPTDAPTAIRQSDPVPHNDADATFAQMMIVHHQGAIEMAQLAAQRGEAEEVTTLAADIERAQRPEIERLTQWLQSWGEPVEPQGDGHMHDESMLMNGKTHEQVMTELRGLSGAEFDQAFLQAMIPHHEGAISMSQTVQREGANPDVQQLAQEIIDSQRAEIEQMQTFLTEQ